MADEFAESAGNGSTSVEAEMSAFTRVVAAMQPLSQESRTKLLRTVSVFFGVESSGGAVTTAPYHHQPAASQPSPFGPRVTGAVPQQPTPQFGEDRSLSPKDFLFQKKPIQDVERIACLAYYLTHYRDTPHFKTLDLSKLNTEAAQIKLSNPAQAVDNATKAGLLIQASKGNKQLSAAGELYVQALPDRQAAREAIAHFRRKKVKRNRTASGNNSGVATDTGDEE